MLLLNSEWTAKENLKWLFGMIAALLFIIYFFSIGSPILATLEIGLTVLALYRTLVGTKRNSGIEKMLGVFTIIIVLILFIEKYTGYIETLQLAGAVCMMIGTFYLIQDKYKAGFAIYALGHLFLTIFGYQRHELIFWYFQLFQVCLCLMVFVDNKDGLRKDWTTFIFIFGFSLFVTIEIGFYLGKY